MALEQFAEVSELALGLSLSGLWYANPLTSGFRALVEIPAASGDSDNADLILEIEVGSGVLIVNQENS